MSNIILEDDSYTVYHYHVTIFNDVFKKVRNFGKQIIGDSDIDDQLLAAPPVIYTINQRDVVYITEAFSCIDTNFHRSYKLNF